MGGERERLERQEGTEKGRENILLTCNAFWSRASNSASTILICSRAGTYAFPLLRKTRRPSTSSGTVSQSTLNHPPPSSSSCRRNPGVALSSWGASSRFSSSETTSQRKSSDSTKAWRSSGSSLLKRSRKRTLSARAKRWRRSSVTEKASRRMKCE